MRAVYFVLWLFRYVAKLAYTLVSATFQAALALALALGIYTGFMWGSELHYRWSTPRFVVGDHVEVYGQQGLIVGELPTGEFRVETHMLVRIANPVKIGPKLISVQVSQLQTFYGHEMDPAGTADALEAEAAAEAAQPAAAEAITDTVPGEIHR